MNRFNKNILVFVFFVIFVISGVLGDCFEHLKWKTINLAVEIKHGNISSFFDYKYYVDDISNKELSYHDDLIDVNSIKDNLLGTRVVKKDDDTVVKADSGSLIGEKDKVSDNDIGIIVENISKLKNVSESNGAKFLYCAAPAKEFYETNPENVVNYFKYNYLKFLSEIKNSQIPYLDFTTYFKNNGISDSELFYYTDHHWKTYSGFVATKSLCEKLENMYGFSYNKDFTDISQYNTKTYPDWFLGSKGKKVGTFFTWHGADDFDLITPKFKTNMTEEQPVKNEQRNGEFNDTVLYMNNMEKGYYNINTYATYSGGDFRLQIMRNNLNPNGKKILMIRDSFACVVAPFLALQTSELHVCDIRDYEYYVGDKLNAEEYIKQIKPDYVIVLYSSVSNVDHSDGRYDFF